MSRRRWAVPWALVLAACRAGDGTAPPTTAPEPRHEPAIATLPTTSAPGVAMALLQHGESRTELHGCLAATSEEEAARFAPAESSRAAPGTPVRVTATTTGVVVTHRIDHACCLHAAVDTRLDAGRIVVAETLSGEPCRCMCSSQISTRVGLAPGDWDLEVLLDDRGATRSVHRQAVSVTRALGAAGVGPAPRP